MQRFQKAMALTGEEFLESVQYYAKVRYRAVQLGSNICL